MKVTWLLQGGFLFETRNKRIVVEAYLSDIVEEKQKLTRLAPSPVRLEQLKPDYWICTHDHLDPQTVKLAAEMYPCCFFAEPTSVCEHFKHLGMSQKRILRLDKRQASIWDMMLE